jgi:S1-C subfamily serine protease
VQSVAGRPVRTPLDWEARLLDTSVGEAIDVVVEENGRQRTLRVPTQDLPSLTAERVRALSDFELVTLTGAFRVERGLSSEQGALIVSLSDAAKNLGLRQGDLIVQINRTPITNAQEAASLMGRLAGRGTVRVIFERDGQLGSASFYVGN